MSHDSYRINQTNVKTLQIIKGKAVTMFEDELDVFIEPLNYEEVLLNLINSEE